MDARFLWAAQIVCFVMATLFGVAGGLVTLWSQTLDERYDGVRLLFQRLWTAIESSRWLQLSDRLLGALIRALRLLSLKLGAHSREHGNFFLLTNAHIIAAVAALEVRVSAPLKVSPWMQLGPPVIVFGYFWYSRVRARRLQAMLTSRPLLAGPPLSSQGRVEPAGPRRRTARINVFAMQGDTVLITYASVASAFGLARAIQMPLSRATPEVFFHIPGVWLVTWGVMMSALVLKHRRSGELSIEALSRMFGQASTAALAIPFSVFATFAGFWLGHFLEPAAPLPQTFQMVACSVTFDVVTIALAYAVLTRASRGGHVRFVPLVLGSIFVLSAISACASLYLGVLGTADQLSVGEVVRVLAGLHPDQPRWRVGPEFWAMHTTFLPLLVALCCILLAWIAKMLLLPFHWLFGKGQAAKSPLAMTATFLGILALISGALSQLFRMLAAHP